MSSLYFERPHGTRDYIMRELEAKHQIESVIRQVFNAWGYDWIATPLLEYEETVRQGLHKEEEEQLYRLFDAAGRTIVLRPEMTTPVARVVATLLAGAPEPLHLAYMERTLRRAPIRSNESSEVTQAGVELLGDRTPDADAEVVGVMISVLQAVGVRSFRVAVGHTGYVGALLQGLPNPVQQDLRRALLRKDAVRYEQLLDQHKDMLSAVELEGLLSLPRIRGGKEAIVEAKKYASRPEALAACRDLEVFYDALMAMEMAEAVQFDLGLYLEHDYYTGILFEGYVPTLGLPICFGGRYDNLLERFGRAMPATGGVLHVERLLSVIDHTHTAARRFELWVEDEQDRPLAYAFAQYLRQLGFAVRLYRNLPPAVSEARESGVFKVGEFFTDDEGLQILYLEFTQ